VTDAGVDSGASAGGVREVLELYWDLCSSAERGALIRLVALSFLVALSQALSVASIMPFMALVADPTLAQRNEYLALLSSRMGFTTPTELLLFLGFAVLGVLVLTNAMYALATWVGLRFVYGQHHRLSVTLLEGYLHRPYEFFGTQNASDLTRTILDEVRLVADGVAVQVVALIAELSVALVLVALLFLVDPTLAILLGGGLGGMYALVFWRLRKRQDRLGQGRIEANSERFISAGEAVEGVKEIQLLGYEARFLSRFESASERFSRNLALGYLSGSLPRYLMETVAFGGLLVTTLYLIGSAGGSAELFATLALFGFAGYKVLPALQHAFQALTRLQLFQPAVEAVHRDVTSAQVTERPRDQVLPGKWGSLRFSGVGYRYPGAEADSLVGVDLEIPFGAAIGVVGGSGSGKTTLLDLLLGLLDPSEGERSLVDPSGTAHTIDSAAAPEWRRRCGYVPQEIFLVDGSVAENVTFGAEAEDPEAVRDALSQAGLDDMLADRDAGMDADVGAGGARISGGQKQRVGIARALYHAGDLIVLDEATSALDAETEEQVLASVRSLRGTRTLVLVAHRVEALRFCDSIILMADGKAVAQGSFDQLLAEEPRFRALHRPDLSGSPVSDG
jgi:ABC-type multidrug transport system fused ATPase/permease subunit